PHCEAPDLSQLLSIRDRVLRSSVPDEFRRSRLALADEGVDRSIIPGTRNTPRVSPNAKNVAGDGQCNGNHIPWLAASIDIAWLSQEALIQPSSGFRF